VAQPRRALHSMKVIKLPSCSFLLCNIYTINKEKRTLPGKDEDDNATEGNGPSTSRRILSSSSSFRPLFTLFCSVSPHPALVCLLIGSPLFSLFCRLLCFSPFVFLFSSLFDFLPLCLL